MACFANKTKMCCARFIAVVSVFLVILGLAAGIYGYLSTDFDAATWNIGQIQDIPSPAAAFGLLAIIAGVFTALTGLLGLCTAKFKKCCFTLPFMIFTFILCILMLITGAIGIGSKTPEAKEYVKEQICQFDNYGNKIEGYDNIEAFSKALYEQSVSNVMCTPYCPCNKEYAEQWAKVSTADLNAKGRDGAISAVSDFDWATNTLDKEDVNFPLWFTDEGTLDDQNGFFNTWKSCYDNRLSKAWEADSSSDGGTGDGTGEFMKTALPFFEQVEKGLDCSGVCYLPAFGVGRDIKDGLPTQECIDGTVNKMEELFIPGCICVLTGLILLFAFFGSIPLCTGFDKDDIMQNDDK